MTHLEFINRSRLGFNHLREHKFRQNFADTKNPLCSCTLETENTEHFFLPAKTTSYLPKQLSTCQNNFRSHKLMKEPYNISNAIHCFRGILYVDNNFDNINYNYQVY